MRESFEKSSGFNLIRGMTYKINAHVPQVDTRGQVFFTMRSLREWTYGLPNYQSRDVLYEETVVAPE